MKTTTVVKDLMVGKPIVLYPHDTLLKAWMTFSEYRISGAPVVDSTGILIGVLSQVDLLREAFSGPFSDFSEEVFSVAIPFNEESSGSGFPERLRSLTVEDAMHQGAIAVTEADSISTVAQLMRKERVHRVIVVDSQETRHVVGIVTALDLLAVI